MALGFNPDDANAYRFRGEAKKYLGDLQGFCDDLKVASSQGDEIVK